VSTDPRRTIPRTDALLADERLAPARRRLGHGLVKARIVEAQNRARACELAPEAIVDAVLDTLPETATTLRPIINATGVIVHTNIGRAPLSDAAIEAVVAAGGYVDVEFDLTTGARAKRGRGALEALSARVPAAEDVHVVNNGAAALLLACLSLAAGKHVLVSRGELIEIGDGFRLPELLQAAGVRLVEVGMTNRTHLRDYEQAIAQAGARGEQVGAICKIHTSNFRVEGFAGVPGVAELATLGVPVIADVGSGLLEPEGVLPDEPDAATWLKDGATVVTASGDKLLGGPQAGLVLGAHAAVESIRRHPLARAMRADKMTLAALEATLRGPDAPVVRSLRQTRESLRERTVRLADALRPALGDVEVVEVVGRVGGGGAPGFELPSLAVALPEGLAEPLRLASPSVIARVSGGRTLVDLRCVPSESDGELERAVLAAAARPGQ
jgi:L-seryl-tRNA(Ser) seleniumtransferase